MAIQERSLAIDIGSTGIRISEFEYPATGGIILHAFNKVELTDQLSETNRTEVITVALRKAYEDGNFTTKNASISVSGQAAFMRFVNLPPVSEEESRIKQIVEYEAKQNVPFPMDEVIWDYQLISGADEDLEVMFVVIKNDIVESVIEAVVAVGLKPKLVDFAPSALYNVARANHVGDNECCMVLNIGGRCSTLLFLDGQRFFARTIPIGGFSISQQIEKEFGISSQEAETLKRRHGFVALGGAYEEPESEVAATISKIVRNIMTRLHGEVNRSISVYRTQQKGNKPVHLYLAGGSSTMAFTDHFFSEKLRLEVSYLNPYKIVSLSENLDVKKLEESAHFFAETVGVGLRNSLECPVEISLTTDSLRQQQSFAIRKPFIIFSCFVWMLILGVFILVNNKTVALFQTTAERKAANVERLKKIKGQIEVFERKQKKVFEKFDSVATVLEYRYDWAFFYNTLQVAKPQDVWLKSIKIMSAPKAGPAKRTAKKKKKRASLFASKRKRGSQSASEQDGIIWFDIVGQAIAIPSSDPERLIFSEEQVTEFGRLQANQAGDGAEEQDTDKSASGDNGATGPLDFLGTNRIESDMILSEVFLRSLHNAGLFSSDPAETRILESRFSDKYRNLTTFRIQLRLEEPIVTKR